jgi:hypothetical protein
MTRPASAGLRIPFNLEGAPSTDPTSNLPCETVGAARGSAALFKWIAYSPNAWGASCVP